MTHLDRKFCNQDLGEGRKKELGSDAVIFKRS